MLRIDGNSGSRYCDGVSRRNFLRIGAMGCAGVVAPLTLPGLLRAEGAKGQKLGHKAIINIHLSGGPSHSDMFDLKPEAPVEFRGAFQPIRTNVPGFEICEHFPQLATMAQRFTAIRSLVGLRDEHSNHQTQCGYIERDLANAGGRPALGSVVAKLLGPTPSGSPPFVAYDGAPQGFIGPVYKGYRPDGGNLRLRGDLTGARLDSRTNLLSQLDLLKRNLDRSGQMEALDAFTQRAVEVVTSGRVADALDVDKESEPTRKRYGREGRQFLTARRLIEAGVRVVTYNWGGWDTHNDNFKHLSKQLPQLDQAMSSLLTDLADRGLDKDVAVVMWGEFGRTPRVNSQAGRDHWSKLGMAFLAGGGWRHCQAIGSSSRLAEEAKDRPVHLHEVFSTLYQHMGIDVNSQQLFDTVGRPQYLVDQRKVIHELV